MNATKADFPRLLHTNILNLYPVRNCREAHSTRRPLWIGFAPPLPLLIAAVAPGGVLIYETFSRGNELVGRPRNPDFLLAPGELHDALAPRLQVVAYEQGRERVPRPAVRQRIVAVNASEPVDLP